MWTTFWDMHSGGGSKEPHEMIYIEAPKDEAKVIFFNRFGHNPERVTCTCCGADYSINEHESLAQATGFHRGCRALNTPRDMRGKCVEPDDPWFKEHYYLEPDEEAEAEQRGYSLSSYSHGTHQTLDDYCKNADVLVIRAADIKPNERKGDVPEQGYVWR
jgi:hypothetical protein